MLLTLKVTAQQVQNFVVKKFNEIKAPHSLLNASRAMGNHMSDLINEHGIIRDFAVPRFHLITYDNCNESVDLDVDLIT